jgi:hypothetical protein
MLSKDLHPCGAGAFACQPRTRPKPLGRIGYQTGADGVLLDVANDPLQFRFIAYPVIEGLILPEGGSRAAQDQIGFPRRGAFQPTGNHG